MQATSQDGPPASPREVLLGAFICFQLALVFVSNFLGYFTWFSSEQEEWGAFINRLAPGFADNKGHGWEWCENLELRVILPWNQLVRQDKVWCLFAPDVGNAASFPGLLLIDEPAEDGRAPGGWTPGYDDIHGHYVNLPAHQSGSSRAEIFPADTEPVDIYSFFRIGNSRIERYEEELYINPEPRVHAKTGVKETADETAQRVTRRLASRMRERSGAATAYVKWRLHCWQEKHPDRAAPRQVILFERYYRIHEPDQPHGWSGPVIVPIARWRLEAGQDVSEAFEAYDFTQHRFSALK